MQDYLYDDKGVYLLYGDCLQRMYDIVDSSVDMVLADLPYGTTACKWDSVIPFEPLWQHYKRIIKPRGAIVLFGSEPFSSKLRFSNLDWFKYDWVWEKTLLTDFLNARNKPLKSHENLCVFSSGTTANCSPNKMAYNPQPYIGKPYRVISRTDKRRGAWEAGSRAPFEVDKLTESDGTNQLPRSILRFRSERGLHPTQKPVALMEYLIRTYTNESETVLDNTMGSGTTGVACRNTNRVFIGIENDEDHYNIAAWRILDEWEEKQQCGKI